MRADESEELCCCQLAWKPSCRIITTNDYKPKAHVFNYFVACFQVYLGCLGAFSKPLATSREELPLH